jgi:hypothetical protein
MCAFFLFIFCLGTQFQQKIGYFVMEDALVSFF